jgi:cytochrome b6-f complex iron-sulfur subunit
MMNAKSEIVSRPSAFTSRREFIQVGLFTVAAAWLGAWLQGRLFPQADTSTEVAPVTIPLAELPVGGTKNISYGGTPVLVLRTPEGLRAYSLICTHLGCIVQWQKDKNEFYCPCHDGRFDEFGDVLAGPPPIPLEQLNVRVEGDRVIVEQA